MILNDERRASNAVLAATFAADSNEVGFIVLLLMYPTMHRKIYYLNLSIYNSLGRKNKSHLFLHKTIKYTFNRYVHTESIPFTARFKCIKDEIPWTADLLTVQLISHR